MWIKYNRKLVSKRFMPWNWEWYENLNVPRKIKNEIFSASLNITISVSVIIKVSTMCWFLTVYG